MTKQVKEFLLDQATGEVNVEYDDNSTTKYNLSNAVTATQSASGVVTFETPIAAAIAALGSGDLSNVEYLPASNGTDDTAAINAVLAHSDILPAGTRRYIRGKVGERYKITASLVVRSYTVLDMQQCGIDTGSSLYPMCTNYASTVNTGVRDTYIGVLGGDWVCGNTAPGSDHRLFFRRIDGFALRGASVTALSGKYCVLISDLSLFHISDLTFDGNSDGLHGTGPLTHGSIHDIFGSTNDDFISLGCTDYLTYDVSRGNLYDIAIANVFPKLKGAAIGGNAVKLFTADGPVTYPDTLRIDKISVSHIRGQVNTNGVIILTHDVVNDSVGTVMIDDVCVTSRQGGYAQVAAYCRCPIENLHVSRLANPENQVLGQDLLLLSGPSTITNPAVYVTDISDNTSSDKVVRAVKVDGGLVVKALHVGGMYGNQNGGANKFGVFVTGASTVEMLFLKGGQWYGSYPVRTISGGLLNKASVSDFTILGTSGGFGLSSAQTTEINFSNVDCSTSTLVTLSGSAGAIVRGAGYMQSSGYVVYKPGTQTFIPESFDLRFDLTRATPTANAMAWNTNAGLACGIGPVVCNGTAWKHLYTDAVYTP